MDAFFKICGLNIKQSAVRILTITAILLAFSTLGQGNGNYVLFSSYEGVYTSEDSNFLQKISYIELKANKICVNGFTAFKPFSNAKVLHVFLVGEEAHAQIKLSSFLTECPFEKIIIEGLEGSSVDFTDTIEEISQIQTTPKIFVINTKINQCDDSIKVLIEEKDKSYRISLYMYDCIHFFNQESICTDQDFFNSTTNVAIHSPIISIGNVNQLGAEIETLFLFGNCIEIDINENKCIKSLYTFILNFITTECRYNNSLKIYNADNNDVLEKIWIEGNVDRDLENHGEGKVFFVENGTNNICNKLEIFINVKSFRCDGALKSHLKNAGDYREKKAQSYQFFEHKSWDVFVGMWNVKKDSNCYDQLCTFNKIFNLNIDINQISSYGTSPNLPKSRNAINFQTCSSSPTMRKNTFP